MVYGITVDEHGFPVITSTDDAPPPPPPIVYIPEAVYVPPPTPADLARFLGWAPFDAEQDLSAQAHLSRALLVVTSYTRHRGRFDDHLSDDLAQVVMGLAGRSLGNPTGASRIEVGTFKSSPGQPEFTLLDRLVMDNYRKRTA